ncbi:MAG: 50S ribosomal protein L20 [Planctomycetia bacterium]|nr:50S ribosomal protein L20 [Planctomycetia bacterium]
MRTKSVVPRLRAKKRLFKRVKGSVGGRRRLLRTAKESLIRSGVFARRDRRRKKRDFRRLWIIRIDSVGFDSVVESVRQVLGLPESTAVAV